MGGAQALAMLLLVVGVAGPDHAQAEETAIHFYTGQQAGTYQVFGEDIIALAKKHRRSMQPITTDGSIDNIKKIALSHQPALGLVQADVLGFMRRSQNADTQAMADNIKMILPLYQEEVHVLARREIRTFADLQGKRVVVGEEGSGNMLTAVNMLAVSDTRVAETLRVNPAQGVLAVLENKADAVIFVGGKPVKLFKNIEHLESVEGKKYAPLLAGVHFIPVTAPEILAEYSTASISHQDYGFVEGSIPTVAVQAVLITGDYSAPEHAAACRLIGGLARDIINNIAELKTSGHPKWREVDAGLPVAMWEKDTCSWPQSVAPAKGAS